MHVWSVRSPSDRVLTRPGSAALANEEAGGGAGAGGRPDSVVGRSKGHVSLQAGEERAHCDLMAGSCATLSATLSACGQRQRVARLEPKARRSAAAVEGGRKSEGWGKASVQQRR